ncbi:unnamed protein product [Adineta steineri]|uniref:Sec1-like protein n=2 Tax=Adineta steineri TaxID=433720 RepID=A0A818YKL6_9BILA|nr:unnamed protein product [Adineta steineri]
MSTSISLSSIQSQHINSLTKFCSNALVLVDTITFEWFRVTNLIGHLFCSIDHPTIKRINDPNLFENNKHTRLIIILSEAISTARLNEICTEENFDSIILLTSSPSIIDINDKNESEENLFDILELKYLQFPFISITDYFFLIPTLIPYRLPTIETLTSLTNEQIKMMTSLDTKFDKYEIKTIQIHAEMLNTLMASMNAREDIFALGPLSHVIAREYTQMTNIKQRRKGGENKIALLLIDRHLDLATPSSHQQDTLLAQIINILPNIRIKSSDGCHERTIDIKVDTRALVKTSSSKSENDFNSYLFADMKRRVENIDAKSIFDNIIYSKSKVATTEVFTHLLESLIYNNLETKLKSVKVSAAAISACLEKFRQSPITVCKNYELLVMSCCLMQLMESISQNQKIERLVGLEKILVQGLTTNTGPSSYSIILQTLKDDLSKPEQQRQLKLMDYVILLVHIYSLAGNDVFYGKEEKDRTHKLIGKEILNESLFTNDLRQEMKTLGYSLEIEHALDVIYQQLDLLLSYKRRYKYLNSLIVDGHDEQPNYRQSLLKQILDLFKLYGNLGSSPSTVQQEQLMHDIEHVPFDGLTDFFRSAARGLFGDTKPNLISNDYSTIVIFIAGGITSHEIQLVQQYSQQIKKQRDCSYHKNMFRVAKASFSNKLIRSQSSTSVKAKKSNQQINKTTENILPIRISSSKYVAEQRSKARDIVLCLQRKNIKLIAIDFDNTLLSIHTSGYYQGTVDNLIEHIRSTFHYFIQEILDSPAFGHTLHLCIVTFSSQEQLIRKLLQLAFKTSKIDQIILRCNTPEFISTMNENDFLGKEFHLTSAVTELATQRNKTIKQHEILLLDDDVQNILIAEKFGHKVLEIRDGINLDILKEFAYNVLSEC